MFQQAPQSSFEEVRRVIEEDLRSPLEELFEGISPGLLIIRIREGSNCLCIASAGALSATEGERRDRSGKGVAPMVP